MTESYYLLVATFLPLLVSPIAYVLARKRGGNATTWFSFGILAISTTLLFIASSNLHGGKSAYEESYTWSQFGNFGLRIDGLSSAICNYYKYPMYCPYSLFKTIHVAQNQRIL